MAGATASRRAVGGHHLAAVLGREQHAVEDVTGGVGGGARRDDAEHLDGAGRDHGGNVRRPRDVPGIRDASQAVCCVCTGNPPHVADNRTTRWSFGPLRAKETVLPLSALIAAANASAGIAKVSGPSAARRRHAGFEPGVEVGDGQKHAVGAAGGEHVGEHGQCGPRGAHAVEELAASLSESAGIWIMVFWELGVSVLGFQSAELREARTTSGCRPSGLM